MYFKYKNQQQVKDYSIDKMMCIKIPDYQLKGDFYSEEFKYLEVQLKKCRGTKCFNQTTIDSFFENLVFSSAFVNSHFHFEDFQNPIEYYIDDSLFFELESQKSKKANFFV